MAHLVLRSPLIDGMLTRNGSQVMAHQPCPYCCLYTGIWKDIPCISEYNSIITLLTIYKISKLKYVLAHSLHNTPVDLAKVHYFNSFTLHAMLKQK